MNGKPTSQPFSLKTRIIILAGAALFLWSLLIFPLLGYTLKILQTSAVKSIQEAQGVAATTVARLLVLEFSQWQDLPQMTFKEQKKGEERIKNLLWEKVVFNEVIEGIELIQAAADDQDRHLTYLYYRGEVSEPGAGHKLEPMVGPQKLMKRFTGLEKELIDGINNRKKVDKNRLEAINQGPLPREMGREVTLRYLPVYVLLSGQGAVYWGVAKIGVSTSAIRLMRSQESQEQSRLRLVIWLEIFLSIALVAILATRLAYQWVRNYTEPLNNLGDAAHRLTTAKPGELDYELENLRRIDPEGQQDIESLKTILIRLGAAVRKLGQRLIITERQACCGRVASGAISGLLGRINQIRTQQGQFEDKEFRDWLDRLGELESLGTEVETAWRTFDLAPMLQSTWRLVTGNLSGTVQATLELPALPPVWGSPAELKLAVLYLMDYAAHLLEPDGELILRALPSPTGGLRIHLQFSGPSLAPEECQNLLSPFQTPVAIPESLEPALAAAIAAQHGGSLKVQPWERGLIFQMDLPKAPVPYESQET